MSLFWYHASAGTQGQCRPEGSCQDGDLGQTNHFGFKQKLQPHSDLSSTELSGEMGQMLFCLLWFFKTILVVADLGQCSGTGGTLSSDKIAGYLGMAGAQLLTSAAWG